MILGSTHRIIFKPAAPSPVKLLLNKYEGAAAAYSLRLLNANYSGPAINVRHTGEGNPSQLIYFKDGELDTETLNTFCGNHNGYVTRWYDQSGNQNDLTQTTASKQPKIYDNTTGVILESGKPTLEFNGSQALLTNATISNVSDYYMFYVRNKTVGNTGYFMDSVTGRLILEGSAFAYFDSVNGTEGTSLSNGYKLVHFELNSTTGGKVYENSINTQTGLNYSQTAISAATAIGSFYSGIASYYDGNVQEFIIYNTNRNLNQTGIENNINKYYKIY